MENPCQPDPGTIILISANSEWKAVKEILSPPEILHSGLWEYFHAVDASDILFFHGGWGKVSAAATTQFVIDHFNPSLIINLGTCGGFAGRITRGAILLVTRTIVYDILEQMGDPESALAHYSTDLDLSWMPAEGYLTADWEMPPIIRTLLLSADRDILMTDVPLLVEKYGAVAADWESGAIAWVAKMNHVRCLILRGVTDLVGAEGGEAYGNIDLFHERTRKVMAELISMYPKILGMDKKN